MSETPEALRTLIEGASAAGPRPERLLAVRKRLEAQLGPLDAPAMRVPTSAGSTLGLKAGVGLVAAAFALWLGTRAPDPVPAHVVTAPRVQVAEQPHVAPVEAAPAPAVVAPAIDVAIAPPAADEPAPRAARPTTRETTPSLAPSPAPSVDPASSLREEIALMDRALRAREAGDVGDARRALEEHRERFPTGTLGLERDRMLSELDAP